MIKMITLNNGYQIPSIGYGTIQQTGEQIINNVVYALTHGYQLIDTANRYGNEVEVGNGLKQSGLARDAYFIETKLGPTLYENETAIEATLKRLDVEYIDVMLLHHPVNNYLYAYKLLEKAYKKGQIKAIGLSNFTIPQIQEILDNCEVKPALMQVECHPYYPAEKVKSFCDEMGIVLQCWYPLGHGSLDLLSEPIIVKLADHYQKSAVQIVLRWHVDSGFCPIPGSKSYEHIQDNADIFDFELTRDDLDQIATLNKHVPFYQVTLESLQRMATTKCNFED